MKLVEIIRGKQTERRDAGARLRLRAARIGKTPIVVNDSRGFFTSRVFGTFVMEGAAMLAEGIAGAADRARRARGRHAGRAAGGARRDLAVALGARDGPDPRRPRGRGPHLRRRRPASCWSSAWSRSSSRPGRAGGGGFYDYPTGRAEAPLAGAEDAVRDAPASTRDIEELKQRLLYRQSIETARCLAEGVLTSVHDANIGSIFGIGFPAWTGGAMQFIASEGRERFFANAAAWPRATASASRSAATSRRARQVALDATRRSPRLAEAGAQREGLRFVRERCALT